MKPKLLVLLLSISFLSYSQFYPKGKHTDSIYHHTYYSLGYSEAHEQAEWVYYELTPEMVNKKVMDRTNDFRVDTTIATGSATKKDYYKSGYDRGHLCPAGDMNFDTTAMRESFLMSNMSPQLPKVNRGDWRIFESDVRKLVKEEGKHIIVTGPIFKGSEVTIGENEVTVPKGYYKVLYNPETKKMCAIVVSNDIAHTEDVVSVDLLESLVGIDFFPGIEGEEAMESVLGYDRLYFTTEKKEVKAVNGSRVGG